MINNLKMRLKDFIQHEVAKSVAQLQQKSDHKKSQLWEDRIAINLPPKEFDNLLKVSNYCDGITHIKPESLKLDMDINKYIENDDFPLPSMEDREGYMGDRHYEYWLGGLSDYLNIKNALQMHGVHLKSGFSIYDMGCASGRVLRHFCCQETGLELWASDININHVNWLMRYMGDEVNIFQNHALPHLPIEDNYLNLIYAFSVFSHIDAFELAWLLELKRILKPGGIAYLTIHSDNTWAIMKEKGRPIYEALLDHPDFTPDMVTSDLPRRKLVYKFHNDSSYRANVFYDTAYINNVWGRYFDIVEIVPEGHNYQDVIMLKKR